MRFLNGKNTELATQRTKGTKVMDMIMKTRARAVGPFPLFDLFILYYCLVDD